MNSIDRSTPPFSIGNPKFSFPDFKLFLLPGGIKIYYLRDATTPLVNFKLMSHKGAYSDTTAGVANFAMSMLNCGTSTRSATDISKHIDYLGSSFYNYANWDESLIGFSCINTNFDKIFSLLIDLVYGSTFHEDEIERNRRKILAAIQSNMAEATYLSSVAFSEAMFESHVYGHPKIGNISSISSIGREELLKFYEDKFLASEKVFFITGNIEEEKIIPLIEDKFSKKLNSIIDIDKEDETLQKIDFTKKIVISEKKDAVQTNIRIGKLTISPNHQDSIAFQIANTIFGGYFLSRLNHRLREDLGFTYGVHSFKDNRKFANVHAINTNVNTNNTNQTLKEIFTIAKNYSENPASEEEINRAKQYIMGSFSRAIETSKQVSSLLLNIETLGLDIDHYSKFFDSIADIDNEQIFNAQKKYFNFDKYVLSVSGNKEELISQLKEFGDIDILEHN